jgi:hypothetical protein
MEARAGIVALTLIALAPSTAIASTPCGPLGAKTLAKTRHARVYVGHVRAVAGGTARRRFGCVRGSRPVALDDPDDYRANLHDQTLRPRSILIRRHFVGYVLDGNFSEGASEHSYTDVVSVDLRRRRVRRTCPSGSDLGCAGEGTRITDFVLRTNGFLAFVGRRELTSIDGDGPHVLDRGVDPGSLRLAAGTLTWTKAGVEHSAALR